MLRRSVARDRRPSLIALTPEARRHVRALREYNENHNRLEAARALRYALTAAWETIITLLEAGLAPPRPYPQLAQPGRAWIKSSATGSRSGPNLHR
jgi:hypothetical protein